VPSGKGSAVCVGAKFFGSALLQPARCVCVSLSVFFHFYFICSFICPENDYHNSSNKGWTKRPIKLINWQCWYKRLSSIDTHLTYRHTYIHTIHTIHTYIFMCSRGATRHNSEIRHNVSRTTKLLERSTHSHYITKSRAYHFITYTNVFVFVCLSVCLSVRKTTKRVVDEFR